MPSLSQSDSDLESAAWLERGDERIELSAVFSVGRSTKCDYVIQDNKISRRHALIQFNPSHKSWLISDMGSKNGVYMNGSKIVKPVTLRHRDEICIGDASFLFHTKQFDDIEQILTVSGVETQIAMEAVPCWILLADIEGSTRLSQTMPQPELSGKIQTWAKECEGVIHHSQGILNEYLGDGILAFWYESRSSTLVIADMLRTFHTLESKSGLAFRILLHHGILQIGGGVSSGLEKLAGKELNFIFRMEKSAGNSGKKTNLTQAAMEQLHSIFPFQRLGEFEIKGFSGRYGLYEPIFEKAGPHS